MIELEKRKTRMEFEQINSILKELYKWMSCFVHFKEKGLFLFVQEDAAKLIQRLKEVGDLIKKDKEDRTKKVEILKTKMDEEDLEFFSENLAEIDKGMHHIMEISGFMLQNMSEQMSMVVAQTLLPSYAVTLLDVSNKKDYEILDSVCFICDCMEHGNEALFNQIVGQAGPKFIELIQFAGKDKEEINYDLMQSCVWGLGCIAKRLPHGKYPYLQETV